VANKLVEEGLARFILNPDHRRSQQLELTDHGQEVTKGIDAIQTHWSNQIAEGLRRHDQEISAQTMRLILEVHDSAKL
jgi:DNA-binding MarR family transcriptional regulator